MTTIAYKHGVIAYDSLLTAGSIVAEINFENKFTSGHRHFFITGSPADANEFINAYNNWNLDYKFELDLEALVYDEAEGKLYRTSIDYDGGREPYIWKHELNLKEHYSIGSGRKHALTAMDCDLSAIAAVAMAAKRDLYTGGAIRSFNIPGWNHNAR